MTTRRLALIAVLLSALPSLAYAQKTSTTASVKIGEKVWVTNTEGYEMRGEVLELSPSFIELKTGGGLRRVAMSDVVAIEKKDSNKEGFIIGASIGCLAEGLTAQSINNSVHTNSAYTYNSTVVGPPVMYCVVGGLFFGGIGAWLDSLSEGRQVLYRKPTEVVALRIAPILDIAGPKRVGVGGSISWR